MFGLFRKKGPVYLVKTETPESRASVAKRLLHLGYVEKCLPNGSFTFRVEGHEQDLMEALEKLGVEYDQGLG